ncbi:DUF2283 domain-containing protein [Candidatus Daviesbacteria bacterium]|nr:DUF2283 domain-containing protein [Candidatus Daviesbacteria bacterium]
MKKTKQKIYYDKKTDVLWFNIRSGAEDEYREISPGVSVELNKKGELLGIEILNASRVLGTKLGFKPTSLDYSTPILNRIR